MDALVAQSVEHFLGKEEVACSIHAKGTNIRNAVNMNRKYYAPRDGTNPPKPFTTDGCSGGMSFIWQTCIKPFTKTDIPWRDCCVEHDKEYWIGGTREDRKEADKKLAECVRNRGYRVWSVLMYYGVRIGGIAYFPFSWRWGYGWKRDIKSIILNLYKGTRIIP